MIRKRLLAGAVFAAGAAWIWLAAAPPAPAHGMSAGHASVYVLNDRVDVSLRLPAIEMYVHFGLDTNRDGQVIRAESIDGYPTLYQFLQASTFMYIDETLVQLQPAKSVYDYETVKDNDGVLFLIFEFTAPAKRPPESVFLGLNRLFFERMGEQQTVIVQFRSDKQEAQGVLSIETFEHEFRMDRPGNLWLQLSEFTVQGIKHIFLGYDHIMFLFALILLGGKFLDLVKIVTAFTVAHSLTLILAALQVVTLPSRLVEAGIALSIVYVAAENLFRSEAKHRWILTFCFGLVHGFGFANVLRELGLPKKGLVLSLLGFNVGVEIGQVVIVAALFPAVMWLSKRPAPFRRRVITAASCAVLAFGLGWLVERAFGLKFMPL